MSNGMSLRLQQYGDCVADMRLLSPYFSDLMPEVRDILFANYVEGKHVGILNLTNWTQKYRQRLSVPRTCCDSTPTVSRGKAISSLTQSRRFMKNSGHMLTMKRKAAKTMRIDSLNDAGFALGGCRCWYRCPRCR